MNSNIYKQVRNIMKKTVFLFSSDTLNSGNIAFMLTDT